MRKPLEPPIRTTLTPNGTYIGYHVEPRRAYTLAPSLTAAEAGDVTEVLSVTQILDKLEKPALPWWGMKVGVEGVLELVNRGRVDDVSAWANYEPRVDAVQGLVDLLTEQKLTTNHVRDKAGDRGQNVHDALERWAMLGTSPNLPDFPVEEQGYVTALMRFLDDMSMDPLDFEVAVGSLEHGFAGRYDLRAACTADSQVVTRVYPVRSPLHTVVPGGTRGIIDLKTSKDVYPTHLLQLEGYEGAGIEGGHDPTNWRAVLHVRPDGQYEFVRSDTKATYDHFLAILGAAEALLAVEENMKVRNQK